MQSVRSPGPECQPIGELLSAFLDDDLSPEERRRVEEHLRTCRYCAADLEDLRLTVRALRALPTVPPPRSFALVEPPARTSWFATLRLATSAMAALFVLVLAINLALPMGSATPLAAPGVPSTFQAYDAESRQFAPASAPSAQTEAFSKSAEAVAEQPMAAARAAEANPAAANIQAAPTPAPSGTQVPGAGVDGAIAPSIALQTAPPPAGTPETAIAAAPVSAPAAADVPQTDAGPPEAVDATLSANAGSAANEQSTRELQPQPLMVEPSEPLWRVWLGWLPLVLAPVVVVLGLATAAAWWRERSWS